MLLHAIRIKINRVKGNRKKDGFQFFKNIKANLSFKISQSDLIKILGSTDKYFEKNKFFLK